VKLTHINKMTLIFLIYHHLINVYYLQDEFLRLSERRLTKSLNIRLNECVKAFVKSRKLILMRFMLQ